MKIEEAINHFKWKFTQSNSKASNKDKSALNTIIRALNEQSEHKVNDNLNFCKLLMWNFRDMCIKNAIKNNYEFIEYDLIYSKLKDAMKLDADQHIEETFKEIQQIQIQGLINRNALTLSRMKQLTTKKEINLVLRRMLNEFIKNN
jgi:hypothetical protein